MTFDQWGRVRYDPALHPKHKTPWLASDERYLIEHYAEDGPEAMSLALERPMTAIATRANTLRRAGKMSRCSKRIRHTRSKA